MEIHVLIIIKCVLPERFTDYGSNGGCAINNGCVMVTIYK